MRPCQAWTTSLGLSKLRRGARPRRRTTLISLRGQASSTRRGFCLFLLFFRDVSMALADEARHPEEG